MNKCSQRALIQHVKHIQKFMQLAAGLIVNYWFWVVSLCVGGEWGELLSNLVSLQNCLGRIYTNLC